MPSASRFATAGRSIGACSNTFCEIAWKASRTLERLGAEQTTSSANAERAAPTPLLRTPQFIALSEPDAAYRHRRRFYAIFFGTFCILFAGGKKDGAGSLVSMTTKDDSAERRIHALMRSEATIHERLQTLRNGLVALVSQIDKLTLRRQKRKDVGASIGVGALPLRGNLFRFHRRKPP